VNNMGIKEVLYNMSPFHRIADRACEEMDKETRELIMEIEENARKIIKEAYEQFIQGIKEFEMNLERDSIATAYLGAKLKESYFRGESVKVPTVEEARGILDEGYRIADKYLAGREFSI